MKFFAQFAQKLGMPEDISASGFYGDGLIVLLHIVMTVLFLGWLVYFILVLYKFGVKKEKAPRAKGHLSHKIEIGVIAFEVVLLIGISIPVWSNVITKFPTKEQNPFEVRVVAQQFVWNIHYPGPDGKFGTTKAELVDGQTNPVGLDSSDPNGDDDIVTNNELYVPKDRPVIVQLTSLDVIHSFFIPSLRVKQDTIPGMEIPTWFTAKKKGDYEIACAQLCGVGHYRMRGEVFVRDQQEIDDWYAQKLEEKSLVGEEDDFWG